LDISVEGKNYGEITRINGVEISLHPAGHIIGSAQIRLSKGGETWVVSGDYKTAPDATCTPFEPVKCQHFITESTFGLPVFQWEDEQVIFNQMERWYKKNHEAGITSVLLVYALGKAQRVIQGLAGKVGTIFTHGAVENTNEVLRQAVVPVAPTERITQDTDLNRVKGGFVLAPPSVQNTSWLRKFNPLSLGVASGWMALRGTRRRRNPDIGFILSDHADWNGLNQAVEATSADHIYVTHGYRNALAGWFNEKGKNASVLDTEFMGELFEEKEGEA
jgi:putative mRNA 3-end processing factor